MSKGNEYNFKDALQAMLKSYRLKSGLTETRVKQLWKQTMGKTISSYTRDIKIYRNKLFITIDSAPLREELSFGKDKIRRNLNEALGEDLIKDVIIR